MGKHMAKPELPKQIKFIRIRDVESAVNLLKQIGRGELSVVNMQIYLNKSLCVEDALKAYDLYVKKVREGIKSSNSMAEVKSYFYHLSPSQDFESVFGKTRFCLDLDSLLDIDKALSEMEGCSLCSLQASYIRVDLTDTLEYKRELVQYYQDMAEYTEFKVNNQ